MRPFEELYTPTRQVHQGINRLQFTPMTPIRETPRRLSFAFSPPKLPVSNRSLVIGIVTFLLVSAVYKSGVIGWTLRMREVEHRARELVSRGIHSSDDAVPMSVYEEAVSEIEQLEGRLISVEAIQSVFNRQCLARDFSAEMQIESEQRQLQECRGDFTSFKKMHEDRITECTDAMDRLEIEQIQVLDKIEAEFEGKLNNLLASKQAVVDQLEVRLMALSDENDALLEELESLDEEVMVLKEQQLMNTVMPSPFNEPILEDASVAEVSPDLRIEAGEADDEASASVPSELESLERSAAVYNMAIAVLSALVALLSVVSGVLYLIVRSSQQEAAESDPLRIEVTERVHTPAVLDVTAMEERDPSDQERLQMAQEDVSARIAREVRAQLEVIEAHHEREMSLMRAIVEETHKTSIEIGSIMKDVMDETSIVSTTNNSPCHSPGTTSSCSFEPTREEMDLSSLSVMLETSVTPIRVPLGARQVDKPTSSIPTCYSIASPSNRSNNRRTRRLSDALNSPSSGEEFNAEDENLNETNFENQMAEVWKNFNC